MEFKPVLDKPYEVSYFLIVLEEICGTFLMKTKGTSAEEELKT